ncbi:MAG: hypothetical protein ACR2RV_07965 [Verrucomicrobiales bacterium]
MKTKSTITLGALILAMAGICSARTWTSADGKHTFEGDFVSATAAKVTVKRSRGNITFDISKLSDTDKEFIKEESARIAADAVAKEASEKLKGAPIPKALSRKLVKLDDAGKRYQKFDLAEGVIPQYYIVYYSASW